MTTTKQSENPIRHRDWDWHDNHRGGATITDEYGNVVARLPDKPLAEQGLRDPRDDAARIVACVNGCEGIPNPAAMKELLAAATELRDFANVALMILVNHSSPETAARFESEMKRLRIAPGITVRANAAIAAVEGK